LNAHFNISNYKKGVRSHLLLFFSLSEAGVGEINMNLFWVLKACPFILIDNDTNIVHGGFNKNYL